MSEIDVDVVIQRPAREIFDYLAPGENLPQWLSTFEAVEPLSAEPPGPGSKYSYRMARGGTESTFEFYDFQPGSRLAWHGPPVKEAGGTIAPRGGIELTDAGGGTEVRLWLDPELSGALKAAGPLMRRQMKKGLKRDLERLKQLLEGAAG